MRAIAMTGFGQPPRLTELPVPVPERGEILVHVETSSLNGFDLRVASGRATPAMDYRFPVVLGRDFAGTVAASEAGEIAPGDVVFGMITKPYLGDGSFADYVAVSGSFGFARVPAGLSMPHAGALALAGTAAQDAVTAADPGPGQAVLVSGATGGVGAFALQLAAARGATAIGTARPGTETDFVRAMGASHVVDYTADIAAAVGRIAPAGVDAVIHLAGDAGRLGALVRRGGRFVSTLGVVSVGRGDVDVTAISASPTQDTLNELAEAVAQARLLVPLAKSYHLADTPRALEDFADGAVGKLGVLIR